MSVSRRHLFVAPTASSYGELVLGLRLAHELRARGDEVRFLAPKANELLFRGTEIPHAPIEKLLPALDRGLRVVLQRDHFDTVVLVDLLVMLLAMKTHGIDPSFLATLPVPVDALDIWDLRRADLRLDLLEGEIQLPESARHLVRRRLVPVPFARLDAEGAYCALPPTPPRLEGSERRDARSALGLREDDRLVLFATSRFQHLSMTGLHAALAALPRHVADLCQGIDDCVRVLHVGPQPITAGARYRHHPQVPAPEYQRLLLAADLMVTMNQSATSISAALALDVPVLVAVNTARPWQFRIYPVGFLSFMAHSLAGNPYAAVAPAVELLPGDAFVTAARGLLFDDAVRAAALAEGRAYVERVRRLPSGADVLQGD